MTSRDPAALMAEVTDGERMREVVAQLEVNRTDTLAEADQRRMTRRALREERRAKRGTRTEEP